MDRIVFAHREKLEKAQKDVEKFLKENGFELGNVDRRQENPRRSLLRWLPSKLATYPIHEAAKQNNPYMVSLLLGLGANPKKKDGWGCTAFDLAKKRSHAAVMDVLRQNEAFEAQISRSKSEGRQCGKLQRCPPPHGFEEFFAKVSKDSSVVQNWEVEWLQLLGPKTEKAVGATKRA
eukprot:Skav227117  [mRNA]  locus=scaffold199:465035:465565:+ [translate_table: standard]